MQSHLYTTDQHVMRYEINLGLPEACETKPFDGHMELDPETSLNILPPTAVRETESRSEKANRE